MNWFQKVSLNEMSGKVLTSPQYGFNAKLRDIRDENNQVVGQRIAYGFAKYMRDALPNATFIGFTGTPVEKQDANTPAVFGSGVTGLCHYSGHDDKIEA